MKFITLTFAAALLMLNSNDTTQPLRIDFGQQKDGQNWMIIVDGVMGGLSRGRKELRENSMYFSGTVSLENNGGFSSCKAPYVRTDLSSYSTFIIRCKGQGQAFALTLDNDRRWYQPYFKKEFTPTEEWQTFEIPLTEFDLYRIGRKLGTGPSDEALASTIRIGITTNSKKEGPFDLEVDYIEFR